MLSILIFNHSLICLTVVNSTLFLIVFFERKCKREIIVKNPLTNNCNTTVDPVKKIFQINHCFVFIYVKQRIISISFLQWFIWELAKLFSLLSYMIKFYIFSKFKPIIYLLQGCNFIFKLDSRNSITNELKFIWQWT